MIMHKDKWLNCKVHNCKGKGIKNKEIKVQKIRTRTYNTNDYLQKYSKFSMIQGDLHSDNGPIYSLRS